MTTKFVLSWVGPTMVRVVEKTVYEDFVKNKLGAGQSDLQIDDVRLTDYAGNRRLVEVDITLSATTVDLERVREWILDRLAAIPGEVPGVFMLTPPEGGS